jgi:predicted aminopeptidase
MTEENRNRRREAAESAADLRDVLREILATPAEDDAIEAKKHAAAALEGIEWAEEALRMWRDYEEVPIELLGEEPRGDGEEG